MATWAQVVDGVVRNPVTVNPEQCFSPEWLANNPSFVDVPDGTRHGAVSNGDGTFANPVVPTPAPRQKALTKAEFEGHLAANGNNLESSLANWPTA
jgi:hypothetical protein